MFFTYQNVTLKVSKGSFFFMNDPLRAELKDTIGPFIREKIRRVLAKTRLR